MENITYKYKRLLTESFRLTNAEEVYNALEANRVGVKLLPEYKNNIKWGYTCEKLNKFFKKCENLGIKDTTYGVQLLLSKCEPNNLENIINSEGFYELLKSYKKPWVKELPEFQTVMNAKFWLGSTVKDLEDLQETIRENQSNHGNAKKGGGDLEDVKELYNDGTWVLQQPTSFKGAKAASFYFEDGKKTPTNWCTRADIRHYDNYSKDQPLNIIKNLKNGKAYQLAFFDDRIEFLDQHDEKGDEITRGDLSKIPEGLLKLVKRKQDGRSLLDYKKAVEKEKPGRNQLDPSRASSADDFDKFEFGPVVQLRDGVCKQEILNYTFDNKKDVLKQYFTTLKDVKNVKGFQFPRKNKATCYFLKSNPNAKLILVTTKGYEDPKKTIVHNGRIATTGGLLEEPRDLEKIQRVAEDDFGITKNHERAEQKEKDLPSRVKKYNTTAEDDSVYEKIFEGLNINWSESKYFNGLESFTPVPRFIYSRDSEKLSGNNVITEISFYPKPEIALEKKLQKNLPVIVLFKNSHGFKDRKDLDDYNKLRIFKSSNYLKADCAFVIWGVGKNDKELLNDKEFAFVKKIATQLQKGILKVPGFARLNELRRLQQSKQKAATFKSKLSSLDINDNYTRELIASKTRPHLYEEVEKYNAEQEWGDFVECGYGDWISELNNKQAEKAIEAYFKKQKIKVLDIADGTPKANKFFKFIDKATKESNYFNY